MEKEWLSAFGKMPYGIYLLTTASEDTINGMIASWVSQISYDPPLIFCTVKKLYSKVRSWRTRSYHNFD
jgi:flavin reductase (DIM6/NTAB) family NADH-FMN oxidoreductase RutF